MSCIRTLLGDVLTRRDDLGEHAAPARTAAASRVFTPSLLKTCSKCFFTVSGLMRRITAISALDWPRAIQRRTSASRRVRPSFLKVETAEALFMHKRPLPTIVPTHKGIDHGQVKRSLTLAAARSPRGRFGLAESFLSVSGPVGNTLFDVLLRTVLLLLHNAN